MAMQSKAAAILAEFDPKDASDKQAMEALGSRLFDAGDYLATGKLLRKEFGEILMALAQWLGQQIGPEECKEWFAGADEQQLGNVKHHAFQTVLRKYVLAAQDGSSLWVIQDVMLLIKCNLEELSYKVKWKGDLEMQAVFGGLEPQRGTLSPPMPLHGLPPALADVPRKATQYTFAYPLADLPLEDDLIESDHRRHFLQYGGFVYLDFEGNVLQINALTTHRISEDCKQLYLSYRHKSPEDFLASELRRLRPLGKPVFGLPKEGHAFAWLSPEDALDLPVQAPHGAFVFAGKDKAVYNCVLCQNETCCPGTTWPQAEEGMEPKKLDALLHKAKSLLRDPMLLDPLCHKMFIEAAQTRPGQLQKAEFCRLFGSVMGLFTNDVIGEEVEDWYGKVESVIDQNKVTEAEFAFAVRSYLKSHIALEQVALQVKKSLNAPRPKTVLAPLTEEGEPILFPTTVRGLWVNRSAKVEILVDGDKYSIVSIPGVDWKLPSKQGQLSQIIQLEGLDETARDRAGIPKTATKVAFAYPMPEVQSITKLTYSAVHSFLALGGYLYLNEENSVLRVSGFSVTNFYKARPISFTAPASVSSQCIAALKREGVWQPSTHLSEVLLGVAGMEQMAWLPARTATQKFHIPGVRHGAFVFLYPTPVGIRGVMMAVICKKHPCCGQSWDLGPSLANASIKRPSTANGRQQPVDESAIKYALKNSRQIMEVGTPAAGGLLWRELFAAAGTEEAGKLHRKECRQVMQIVMDHLGISCTAERFDVLFRGLDEKMKGFLLEDDFVCVMDMLMMHSRKLQRQGPYMDSQRYLPVIPTAMAEMSIVVDVDLMQYTVTYPTTDEESATFSGGISPLTELREAPEWLQAQGIPALARFVVMAYPVQGLADTIEKFATADMLSLAEVGAILYLSGEHEVMKTKVLLAAEDTTRSAPPLYLSAPISFPPLYIKKAMVENPRYLEPVHIPVWAPQGSTKWVWLAPNDPLLTDQGKHCPHGGFLYNGAAANQDQAYVLLCHRWQCCGSTWSQSNVWKRELPSKQEAKINRTIRSCDLDTLELFGDQFKTFVKELFEELDEYGEGYLDRSDAFTACLRWGLRLGVPLSHEDYMHMFDEDLDECSQEVTVDQLLYCMQVLMHVKKTLWRVSVEQPLVVKQQSPWRNSFRILFSTPLDAIELTPLAEYRFADGRYSVKNAVKIHPMFDGVAATGFMSSPQELTLDSQGRAKACIPKRARYYSFVYPIDQQPLKLHLMKALLAVQETDPRVGLMLTGGFVYLDSTKKQILAASAVYSRPPPVNPKDIEPQNMFLAPPAALPEQTYLHLDQNRRLHPMPTPFLPDLGSREDFQEQRGAWFMAWIPPLTPAGLAPGLPHEARRHGAFVCVQRQGTLVSEAVFYSLLCQRRKCCGPWWESAEVAGSE